MPGTLVWPPMSVGSALPGHTASLPVHGFSLGPKHYICAVPSSLRLVSTFPLLPTLEPISYKHPMRPGELHSSLSTEMNTPTTFLFCQPHSDTTTALLL